MNPNPTEHIRTSTHYTSHINIRTSTRPYTRTEMHALQIIHSPLQCANTYLDAGSYSCPSRARSARSRIFHNGPLCAPDFHSYTQMRFDLQAVQLINLHTQFTHMLTFTMGPKQSTSESCAKDNRENEHRNMLKWI